MCLAIMACAVCWKKVLMRNPLNVLGGNLGDLENFAKVSGSLGNSAKGRLLNTTKRSSEKFSDDLLG